MLRRLLLVLCAIAVAGAMFSAEARKKRRYYDSDPGLVVIAELDVDMSVEKFIVDTSFAKGAYRGIRIKNVRGELFDVQRVEVVYKDGQPHIEDRQIDMYEGERSRPINETYENRFIDRVAVTQIPGRGRGRFQVLGIQDAEGRRMDRSGNYSPGDYTRPTPSRPDSGDQISTRPTSPTPTPATPGRPMGDGEVMFGAEYVGFATDRDVIRVGNEVGKFQRIRFRVLDNDIFINEIKVVYANGSDDVLAVNAEIPKNSRTNWIDLKGDRFIKEIQLVYRSRPSFSGQARIEVFGQYADGWLSPGGEGSKYNQGWVLLGAQTAGFVGFDRDVIPVGRNEGGFKRVRVNVRDRAITLNEVKIIYVDGIEETVPIREKVDAGSFYGPIDLKGERRQAIERIEAKYRSRIFSAGRGAAIVEIWGQH